MNASYLRAAISRKPAWTVGTRIPRIERQMPAVVLNEHRVEQLRRLTNYPNNGYLPFTFPFVHALPTHLENMLDPRFPLPVIGTVHVRSEVLQRRPIGAGEAVRTVCFIEGQHEDEKGVSFDLHTLLYAGSELVWESKDTMLRRLPHERTLPTSAARAALDGVGAQSTLWRIKPATARAFAFATGDLNPIHLSSWTARLFGFASIIAHGSWSEMRLAGTQPELVKQAMTALHCDFKQPILLPATVICRQWPLNPPGTRASTSQAWELRLLDKTGRKPHLVARMGPLEALS